MQLACSFLLKKRQILCEVFKAFMSGHPQLSWLDCLIQANLASWPFLDCPRYMEGVTAQSLYQGHVPMFHSHLTPQ